MEKNLENEPEYAIVKSNLELALDEALVNSDIITNSIIYDEMIDNSNMISMSSNWNFTTITTGDLINDPEQIQRTNLNDGEVIYDATNIDTFRVDFWGIKDQTTAEYGTIKAFTSTDNITYNEIILNSEESHYTEYRRLFYYTPDSQLPNGTTYLKIVLTGGDQSWKGLISGVELFDEQPFTPTDFSFIDNLTVTPDPSLFNFEDTDLRTNEDGLPSFSDPLSNTNNFYRTSGNFYFSNILPEDYDDDTSRLVRSNTNTQDIELVYDIDALNYFRIEFWTYKNRSLADISNITGQIQTYISENADIPEDYTEVPLKFARIKIIGDWILYALVSETEIETNVNFFKTTITGGTEGSMWGGQYGAIHLYDSSLANQDDTLSTTEETLSTVSIFPNPTKDIVNIEGLNNESKISIYNTVGQLVYQVKTNNSINISHLKSGLYFLKIENNKTFRFIKQ